jgi:hypothetical protein
MSATNQLLSVVLAFQFAAGIGTTAQSEWTGVERVVAVGDIHGDYAGFVSVLRAARIIDEKEKWIGGKTHLVQTGDVLDRGADSRKVMDLLMSLEKQAAKTGGRVHALIGNHEAMNLYGDLRYTTAGEFAAFRSGQSEEVRAAFRDSETKAQAAQAGDAVRKKWESEHPLGWVEHRVEFGPKGKYGKWIRSHQAVIKINGSLYMHGGISPRFAAFSLDQINDMVAAELNDFSKINDKGAVTAEDGPLWYRGLSQDENAAPPDHVDRLLTTYGVSQVVVAHTPTAGAVLPRYAGKVLLIDVGLSSYYGGHPVCLVQEGKMTYAVHRGTRIALPSDAAEDLARYLKSTVELEPSGSALAKHLAGVEAALASKK